jgi:glycine betaine catabolism A
MIPLMPSPVATRPLRTTLPARFYTDLDHFRRETQHFFYHKWICAGRIDRMTKRGDYTLQRVLDESVIITRSDDPGAHHGLRAFYNVCRHRGTRLCEAPCGTFPGAIQCPYHAWTYDLRGSLIGAPHMDDVGGFDRRNYGLKPVACDVWDCHVFINLSGSAAPLSSQVGPLVERFRPWRMEDLRVVHRAVYDVKANWKLIVQNYNECLHCPVLHPLLNQMHHYLGADNAPSTAAFCGGTMGLREGIETLSRDGRLRRRYLPGLGEAERSLVSYFSIYPNLLLTLHPDYMMTVTLWPQAPDRTELVAEWSFHHEEIARAGFEFQDAVDFWEVTNREDWHVSELSQAGIASRAYEPGPYSNRETLLWDFDQIVLRELGLDP